MVVDDSSIQYNDNDKDTKFEYQPNIDGMYYKVLCGVSSYFKLDTIEIIVLSFVGSFHSKKKDCYASKSLIARIASVSDVTVFKVLKRLKEKMYIEQYNHKGKVCLKLGPEVVDRWKYIEKIVEKARDEKKGGK